MLSYQHIYHAENAADVHKHGLLAWVLGYMTSKDKPLTYIETHAGRGLYDLGSAEARKTGEAEAGIDRALSEGWFPPGHPYPGVVAATRAKAGPLAYPGSPRIAAAMLRAGDRIVLAELHPAENAALRTAMAGTGAQIVQEDGLQMLASRTPPDPRRGLALIDPSFEVKADYARLPKLVAQVHRKWNVGVILLWYPILTTGLHEKMLDALTAFDLPGALRHEVRFPPARAGHGMVGSGLYAVNAPWGMADEAARLAQAMGGAFR